MFEFRNLLMGVGDYPQETKLIIQFLLPRWHSSSEVKFPCYSAGSTWFTSRRTKSGVNPIALDECHTDVMISTFYYAKATLAISLTMASDSGGGGGGIGHIKSRSGYFFSTPIPIEQKSLLDRKVPYTLDTNTLSFLLRQVDFKHYCLMPVELASCWIVSNAVRDDIVLQCVFNVFRLALPGMLCLMYARLILTCLSFSDRMTYQISGSEILVKTSAQGRLATIFDVMSQ